MGIKIICTNNTRVYINYNAYIHVLRKYMYVLHVSSLKVQFSVSLGVLVHKEFKFSSFFSLGLIKIFGTLILNLKNRHFSCHGPIFHPVTGNRVAITAKKYFSFSPLGVTLGLLSR